MNLLIDTVKDLHFFLGNAWEIFMDPGDLTTSNAPSPLIG
jgi:hypothetical protein